VENSVEYAAASVLGGLNKFRKQIDRRPRVTGAASGGRSNVSTLPASSLLLNIIGWHRLL
jgi:hypothetical protein